METRIKYESSAPHLISAVENLRKRLEQDLGVSPEGVFPVLDDLDAAARFWATSDTASGEDIQSKPWTRARMLVSPNALPLLLARYSGKEGVVDPVTGCLELEWDLVLNDRNEEGEDSETARMTHTLDLSSNSREKLKRTIKDGPLSQLAGFLVEASEPPPSASPCSVVSPSDEDASPSSTTPLMQRLMRMYHEVNWLEDVEDAMSALASAAPSKGRHPNLCPLVAALRKSSERTYVVSTGLPSRTMVTISKYERNLFRLSEASETLETPKTSTPFDASTESTAASEPGGAPLLGSDPILDGENDLPARFLLYQAVSLVRFLHESADTTHGGLSDALGVAEDGFLRVAPPAASTAPRALLVRGENLTRLWRRGELSNFDYLMAVNRASGRRAAGRGAFHALLPWVHDFAAGELRDLTRSKYRLKKGDVQLGATFHHPYRSQAHHLPESLSDLTYCVYAARVMPLPALLRVVRANFEPKEYPASIARLYEWTPDEAVPEFFLDAAWFRASKLLPALEHPPPQDHHLFLTTHLERLESDDTSRGLPRWINLNFGSALHGGEAIAEMNVPLAHRPRPAFVRAFSEPHPMKLSTLAQRELSNQDAHRRTASSLNPATLRGLLKLMLAPRNGLRLRSSTTHAVLGFTGNDFIEWLLEKGMPTVVTTEEAREIGTRMLRAGYFIPSELPAGETHEEFSDDADVWYRFRDHRVDPPAQALQQQQLSVPEQPSGGGFSNEEEEGALNHNHAQLVSLQECEARDGLQTVFVQPASLGEAWLRESSLDKRFSLQRRDWRELGYVAAQMYLGREVSLEADSNNDGGVHLRGDLHLLSPSVRRALECMILEGRDPSDRLAFPAYFPALHAFLAKCQADDEEAAEDAGLDEEEGETSCAFATYFELFASSIDRPDELRSATLLTFPRALRTMTRPNRPATWMRDVHRALSAFGDAEPASLRRLVESALEACAPNVAAEALLRLPCDVFVGRFVDLVCSSSSESDETAGRAARALADRAASDARFAADALLPELRARRLEAGGAPAAPLLARLLGGLQARATSPDPSTVVDWFGTPTAGGPRGFLAHRFVAHPDAPVACLAASPWERHDVASASRRSEIALWRWSDGASVAEVARFRLDGADKGSVVNLRFSPFVPNELILTHSTRGIAFANLEDKRTGPWLPGAKCIEALDEHNDPFGWVLGGAPATAASFGEQVVLIDRRARRTMGRISCGLTSSSKPIVGLVSLGKTFLVSAGDRMLELDARVAGDAMPGRVVREWKSSRGGSAKLTRLPEVDDDSARATRLVFAHRGSTGGSLWEIPLTGDAPTERVRASITPSFHPVDLPSSEPLESSASSTFFTHDADAAPTAEAAPAPPTLRPGSMGGGSSTGVEEFAAMNSNPASSMTAAPLETQSSALLKSFAADGRRALSVTLVGGDHTFACVPLQLHPAPVEVRVRSSVLAHHNPTGSSLGAGGEAKFRRGQIAATAVGTLVKENVVIMGTTHPAPGRAPAGWISVIR